MSNLELYRLGQKSRLARYPMHWHMQGTNGAGQFIEDSSIHRSFNRAVTIHGTESARVERNVAYDHLGHGMFLEDGSERFNQMNYNLALLTKRPAPGEEWRFALCRVDVSVDFEGPDLTTCAPLSLIFVTDLC